MFEQISQLLEEHHIAVAERLIADLRHTIAQLDLAIANYQDAYAQLRAAS